MSPAPTQAYEDNPEEDSLEHWYRTPVSPDQPDQDILRQEQIERDERLARQLAEEDRQRSPQSSQLSAPVLPVYSSDGMPEPKVRISVCVAIKEKTLQAALRREEEKTRLEEKNILEKQNFTR